MNDIALIRKWYNKLQFPDPLHAPRFSLIILRLRIAIDVVTCVLQIV